MFWLLACAPPAEELESDATAPSASVTEALSVETPEGPPAPLVINEVMAANDSTWVTADGARPDWVELMVVGDEAIDLARVVLADDAGHHWQGAGVLQPSEILLVDTLPFGLDADGDLVAVLLDGTEVDRLTWTDLGADTVLARIPDGTGAATPTAWPTPGATNGIEASPTLDPADATVFHTRGVLEIALTVAPEDWDVLAEGGGLLGLNQNYTEVPAELTIDDIPYPQVGLRRKGAASSDDLDRGQPPLKVDFNAFVPGTRFRTLKGLNLHNGKVLDPTKCRDHVTYLLARESGLMAPRVGWAQVWLNDEYYGLYVMVEQHDDVMVERFRPGQGETGVVIEPNDNASLLAPSDFGHPGTIAWDIEEGPIPSDPDMIALIDAIDDLVRLPASDANVAQLWTLADEQGVLTYLAWEAVVGHHDGYFKPNNWRVFLDADVQRLHLVPSGAEWTWDQPVDPWVWTGTLGNWCMRNDGCWHDYAAAIIDVAERAQTLDLAGEFDAVSSSVGPLVDADPRRPHPQGVITASRASTLDNLVRFPVDAIDDACRAWPDLCP